MWKIYHSSPIFDRELRPHLKLPDQKKGSLSDWFEETIPIKTKKYAKTKNSGVGFIQCESLAVCVKKHLRRKLRRYKSLDRHAVIKRYNLHRELFDLGIPVPEPYACLYEYDNARRTIRAYYIHSQLEGAKNLGAFLRSHCTMEQRQQVFPQLGRAIASMHKHRYLHKDLHKGNVMVNGREIFLIDMGNSIRLPKYLPQLCTRRHFNGELVQAIMKLTPPPLSPNPEICESTYIVMCSFFAEYCKTSEMKPSRLLKDIRYRLDNIKSKLAKESSTTRNKIKEKKLERAYGWLEYATEFLDCASAK